MIFNKEGKLIIGARAKTKLFGFPGGHLEYKETFAYGCSKEIEEETGLKIPEKDLKLFCVFNAADESTKYHAIDILFVAKCPEG